MTFADATMLALGTPVRVGDVETRIERRAGTDKKPIVRLEGCATREAAEALRGSPVLVARGDTPGLDPGEFWADDLVGCSVGDGDVAVGEVARVIALPSCEALEITPGGRLIPLVRDAVRDVDLEARRIDVDLSFLGDT